MERRIDKRDEYIINYVFLENVLNYEFEKYSIHCVLFYVSTLYVTRGT